MSSDEVLSAVQSALLEVNGGFTGQGLIGELGDVATRLISALEYQGLRLELPDDE